MNTIQWQTTSFSFEMEQDDFEHRNTPETKSTMSAEREESQTIQKSKYKDPSTNENRKNHIALVEKFGALLVDNKLEKIAQDLLSDDIEIFIFRSTAKSVQYANRADEFANLYNNVVIRERIARETDFDEEKATVCQICTYKTIFKDESSPIDEVACELFTIKDGRISKYRVSFGRAKFDINQFTAPLEPTRKEKMLAKVKEINYALAGQPDFEKVASLLDENVEYKLCAWDAFKSEMLFKDNFAWSFKKMFENTTLLSIVPYEIYTNNEHENFITGTYVYNLKDKISGKNSVWLSTCVYGFNQNISITKVIHHGEMYEEDEIDIPFEVFTRSQIEQRLREYYTMSDTRMDRFYNDKILYDCTLWGLCIALPGTGYYQGLKDIKELMKAASICNELNPEFIKILDVYVDYHNKSHDVAYALLCSQGPSLNNDGKVNREEVVNCIGFIRIAYENGKMAKMLEIMSELRDKIPTPFEDKDFYFINRKS